MKNSQQYRSNGPVQRTGDGSRAGRFSGPSATQSQAGGFQGPNGSVTTVESAKSCVTTPG